MNLHLMEGIDLRSISGRTNISIVDINDDYVVVRTASGEVRTRSLDELKRVVDQMELLKPVHIDSVLRGSGSSRNQPETIVANLPDVEYVRLNKVKHVVWVGRKTHEIGTIREADPFTRSQLRGFFEEKAESSRSAAARFLIVSNDLKPAHELMRIVLRPDRVRAVSGSRGYSLRGSFGEALLVPWAFQLDIEPRLIPLLQVPDANEAANRASALVPSSAIQSFMLDCLCVIVTSKGIPVFAFEQLGGTHEKNP